MASFEVIDVFAALDSSVKKTSKNSGSALKKCERKESQTVAPLKNDALLDFEMMYPVVIILYCIKGVCCYNIGVTKLSSKLKINHGKGISMKILEHALNLSVNKPGLASVYESHVSARTYDVLERNQHNVPTRFEQHFKLVRSDKQRFNCKSITPAVIVDYRPKRLVTPGNTELAVLPNGKRIHFGSEYDKVFEKLSANVSEIKKVYEKSLETFHIEDVFDAIHDLFDSKTLSKEEYVRMCDARKCISYYDSLYSSEEMTEIENLMCFKDVKELEGFLNEVNDFKKYVFQMIDKMNDILERRRISRSLADKESFPSLF